MRINNKRMERFHMRVNSFTYQPYAVEREVFQPERSLRPVLGKRVLTPKSMQLVAEFRSKKDISDFLAEPTRRRILAGLVQGDDPVVRHTGRKQTPVVTQ